MQPQVLVEILPLVLPTQQLSMWQQVQEQFIVPLIMLMMQVAIVTSGTPSGSPLTLTHALTQVSSACAATINIAAGTYTDDLIDITSSHDGVTIAGAGIASTIFEQSGSGDHFMEIKKFS